MKQPRLRFWLTEYFGEAKTSIGDCWWYDDLQDDGSTRRIPLIPIKACVCGDTNGHAIVLQSAKFAGIV